MIKRTFYKDRPAIQVANDEFSALFLPFDGAKLVSFKDNEGYEFLAQADNKEYRRLFLDTDYEKSECSGFDDMFPTIDPCEINGQKYLDHGEVCRRGHSVAIEKETAIFSCDLPDLNVCYEKTVYCLDDALFIKYTIQNNNDFEFPYIWAAHAMFKGEEGAYAFSNFHPDTEKIFLSGNPDKSSPHILPPRESGIKHYKYYYNEENSPLICGMVYPKCGRKITMKFNNDIVKYLGFWVNPGDLNGMYNLAVEPCTAPFDSPVKAEKVNAASYIKAKGKIEFILKLSYKNF